MEITKRGVIDLGRGCHLVCRHCFHRYSDDETFGHTNEKFKKLEVVKAEIKHLFNQKRTAVSFTGGEPLIHPNIQAIVKYAMDHNLKPEIITAGIPNKVKELRRRLGAGSIDWLFSLHGSPVMHNYITGNHEAWHNVFLSIFYLNEDPYRFNHVVMSYNFGSIEHFYGHYADIVFKGLEFKDPYAPPMNLPVPKQINFIKWRPFYGWPKEESELLIFGNGKWENCKQDRSYIWLWKALDFSDVNVRYFPYCQMAPFSSLQKRANKENQFIGNLNYWSTRNYMYDPWEWCNDDIDESTAKGIMMGKWMKRLEYRDECKSCIHIDTDCEGFLKEYE